MPEKEITVEQQEAVSKWVKENGGSWVVGFRHGYIGSGFYKAGGEPLVIYAVERAAPHSKGGRLVYDLYCSDKHAQSLEKAGIIKFSLEP